MKYEVVFGNGDERTDKRVLHVGYFHAKVIAGKGEFLTIAQLKKRLAKRAA